MKFKPQVTSKKVNFMKFNPQVTSDYKVLGSHSE